MCLALARKPLRPQPGACLDECRALFGCPVVRRRQPCRAKVAADRTASKGGDGGRGVGWAIDGGACLGNRLAGQFGHDRQSQHIRRAALVSGHAKRGIALEMFNGAEILLMRQLHILDGHIVLLVEPGAFLARNMP